MKVKVVLLRRKEGGYLARVLTVPGLVSMGRSKRAALRNIRKTILIYLDPDFAGEHSAKRKTIAEVRI
jgi:predicted RNase H-like HicB family nuclease